MPSRSRCRCDSRTCHAGAFPLLIFSPSLVECCWKFLEDNQKVRMVSDSILVHAVWCHLTHKCGWARERIPFGELICQEAFKPPIESAQDTSNYHLFWRLYYRFLFHNVSF